LWSLARETPVEKFADTMPGGQFSMTSLQSHLMHFKDRLHEAVEATKECVEKETRKRGGTIKEYEKVGR
jgi:hypothetical protein